jgi:hypothetical protein
MAAGNSIHPVVVDGQLDPEGLVLVRTGARASIREANGDVLEFTRSSFTKFKEFRNTLHFSLNHLVAPHTEASWEEDSPYVMIADYSAVCERNRPPTGLNTVDTWWTRGPNEPLILPNPYIIAPDKEGVLTKSALLKPDAAKKQTLYKCKNFTADEIKKILKAAPHYPDHDFYISHLGKRVNTLLADKGITWNHLTDATLHSLDSERGAALSAAIGGYVKRLATDAAIYSLGYEIQPGGEHGWSRYDIPVVPMTTKLRKEQGIPYPDHFHSPYRHLELALQPLADIQRSVSAGEMPREQAQKEALSYLAQASSILRHKDSEKPIDNGTRKVAGLTVAEARKNLGMRPSPPERDLSPAHR